MLPCGMAGARMSFQSFPASVLLVVALLAATPASGRQTLETDHFLFVHNGKASGLAERLAEIAEARRNYIRYMVGLDRDDNEKVEVRIAVTEDEMQEMTESSSRVEKWIAGLTFRGADLIVMSARGTEYFKASDTFVHELAHLYLDKAVGDRFIPRWFHEGFAMLAASEDAGERMHSILAATATGSLIPLKDLVNRFPDVQPAVSLAYAQSMFFVRFLQRSSGSGGVRELIDDLKAGMPFEAAFRSTWKATPEEMFSMFQDSFSRVDSVIAFLTSATLLWGLMVGIFLFVYFRKKSMARKKMELWELEDELQRERILRAMGDYLDLAGDDGTGRGRGEDIN